jgi:hypothetical protein
VTNLAETALLGGERHQSRRPSSVEGARPAGSALIAGPSIWPFVKSKHPRGWLEPAVPVTLIGPRTTGKTIARLDSGADNTAIPFEWAGSLGVDLDQAIPLTAFGNGALAEYLQPIEPLKLEIAGRVIDLKPMFGPWPEMMLGRDVFAHFRITFDERAQTVILDPYDP